MRQFCHILLLLICLGATEAYGQTTDTTSSQQPTTQDDVKLMTTNDTAGSDSITADKAAKLNKQFVPNPQHALYYSLVPGLGLGQIYNRKYWKMPIVYAGYAAIIYALIYTNGKYNDYRSAYISIADEDSSTNDYVSYIPNGQTAETVDMAWLTNSLNQRYMRFRRYRDLSIIGLVAWYGLTILDAYVDAQLFDFDISPNLSLRIEPEINITRESNVGLNCSLSF